MTKPEFARAATPKFKTRYDNFIGGRWVAPVNGRYFENTSPVNGRVLCEVARSDAADVELALDEDVAVLVLAHRQTGARHEVARRLRHQQVVHVLAVDLQERRFHFVRDLLIFWVVQVLEQVVHEAGNEAQGGDVVVAHVRRAHREGLSRASLTVCEGRQLSAADYTPNNREQTYMR